MLRHALLALLPLTLCAAEPSAFGAGDLDSANPYGLTTSEKKILSNKEKLESIQHKTRTFDSDITSLRERLDGLQTIVEGLTLKAHENRVELGKVVEGARSESAGAIERTQSLESKIDANAEQIAALKNLLQELSQTLDKINANYVTKSEYNTLVEDINTFKTLVGKELKQRSSSSTSASDPYAGKSKADIAEDAYALYKKKYYTKAIEHYEYLIEKNYKPARAHYMIGEMWYYRKDYDKAIAYFKESARRYDKADYMPTLLLHAAVAMEKTGDSENARAFYNALITKYPETSMAAEAQKRLDRL